MKEKIFEYLEAIGQIFPAPIYWFDLESRFIGLNKLSLHAIGGKTFDDIIGKTPCEIGYYGAAEIVEHNKKVIQSGETLSQEDVISNIETNEIRSFLAVRSPIFNDHGKIIGVLGTSVETTAEKEAERLIHENRKLEEENRLNQIKLEKETAESERLRLENQLHKLELENEMHKAILAEQERFQKISAQVAHDIGSPLAALQMIIPHCDLLPENTRNVLNKSAIRIADIAENFLSQFKPKESQNNNDVTRMPTLISTELLEVMTEKKYEYSKLPIDFSTNISQSGAFAFINIDSRVFKRMLSNLINNAVDAIEDKIGNVSIILDTTPDNQVQIKLTDNGKGMPLSVKEKLLNNIQVTEGKANGHGIGFTQIRETLVNNEGHFDIQSQEGVGSTIILTFPKINTPTWMAEDIELRHNDLIVILDDDDSIHDAWEARFEKSAPGIKRQHFKQGNDAVNFINTFSPEDKQNIFLLTDYELLRQNLHGLDVIEQTKINRSILVTSHHGNLSIRDKARQDNTKILPKPLAPAISITISEAEVRTNTKQQLKSVNLVLLDDDKIVTDTILNFVVKDPSLIDIYHKPQDLLDSLSQYNKNTLFLIDNQYRSENINGIEISEKLYFQGYTNLYLFTGAYFADQTMIPDYLRIINKTDLQAITELLR